MKKLISIILILSSNIILAQEVLNSAVVDIPYIGKNGGAHILNWSFNEDKSKIHLYAYSNVNGSFLIASQNEIQDSKSKHDKKSYFGKLVSSAVEDNLYNNITIPVISEDIIDISNLSTTEHMNLLFHNIENVPEGKDVYFKKNTAMLDMSFPFESGVEVKYHYKDLDKPLKYAPKYNKEILNFNDIELKAEAFSLIQPTLVNKKATFTYDDYKGFITNTATKDIVNLSKSDELNGYRFILKSNQALDNYYYSWFVKDKDYSKYKLVISDDKGTLKVKSYDFEVPRKLKVFNKAVYNRNLDLKGTLSVFGYHRKGKKNKDIYPVNKFDVIYLKPNGDDIYTKKINFGTEKAYKNVIKPILLVEEDQKIKFINNHMFSLFKSNYEVFNLNKEGNTEVISTGNFSVIENEIRRNYYDYLVEYDKIDRFGDYYVLRKVIAEKIDPNDESGVVVDTKVNYVILDKNFKPISFKSLPISPQSIKRISFQTVEKNDKEQVYIARKENFYNLIKISIVDSKPKIEIFPIETKFDKTPTPILYFGCYDKNVTLVDKEKRHIFLMSQFYNQADYNKKIIEKIGITKIKY